MARPVRYPGFPLPIPINVIRPSRVLVISRPRVGVPDSYELLLSRIGVAVQVKEPLRVAPFPMLEPTVNEAGALPL